MASKRKKILLLAGKLVLAAVLVAWVLNQASWDDYVVTSDKKTYSVIMARPDGFEVSRGHLWWKQTLHLDHSQVVALLDEHNQPIVDSSGKQIIVRPGFHSSLRGIAWGWVGLAMAGFFIAALIAAIRWRFLLKIQDVHIPLWESIRLKFLGDLFNNVMPGGVGGDLIKAYYACRHTPLKAAVLVSTFVDRVLGLTELTLLSGAIILVALTTGLETYENIKLGVWTDLTALALIIGTMTFILSARVRQIFHMEKIYSRLPIAHHIAAAGDAAKVYRRRIGALVKAVGITFGAHIVWIGSIALLGVSFPLMHQTVKWYQYFMYLPLVYIIGALPITFGGAGLIEGLYVKFFLAAGSSTALAYALLARLAQVLCATPGILVAMTGPKLPKTAAIEAELEADESLKQRGA